MNDIELNAIVALEDLADTILFIFDASETCGYYLENQYNLFCEIQNIFDIPFIPLFNKIDLTEYDKKGENYEYINQFIEKTENPLIISAYEGNGIDEILTKFDSIEKIPRSKYPDDDDYY